MKKIGSSFRPFPATEWSLVDRVRDGDEGERAQALATLLQRYLPALRAHLVMGRGIGVERAQDLLQGFVADKIIEQDLLSHAAREKGRFRSFLLATLDRYVISAARGESAAKRRPSGGVATLDDDAHDVHVDPPADPFNVAWARELIAEALRRMQDECERSKRHDVWTVFNGRIVRPTFDGSEPLTYERLVAELQLAAPLQACNLLITAKRMFSRNLRAVAGEYADTDAQIDEELADLRRILCDH